MSIRILLAPWASFSLVQAASNVTLEWEPSPDPGVVGYFLFSGIVGTSYVSFMDVGNQTKATLTNLFGGVTNFFFVTAYNANGSEGPPSDVIFTNLPGSYPAPTISTVPGQLIGQNTSTAPIALTIGDALFDGASLRLSGKSSNPALVPNNNILFGGAGTNRTMIVLPALGQVGLAVITLTVSDEIRSASTSFLLRVGPAAPDTLVYLPFEAESGTLVSPMAVSADPNASGGQYISIDDFWSGSATFAVNVPVSGAYVIWRRTFARDRSVWSFNVFADDTASHLFDEVLPTVKNAWQWALVNGSFGFEVPDSDSLEPSLSVFPFTVGPHTISFHGLDEDIRLDGILITNDRNFVPPVLTVPPRQTIKELTTLVVTNTAAVSDPSTASLSFSLTTAPSGVTLDPVTGVLSWTPTEDQGPSTNVIGVQVTDKRLQPLSDRSSFTVIVEEVNSSPEIAQVPRQTIRPGSLLTVTNTAFDPDIPPDRLTFSLGVGAPAGASIDPTSGVFTWKPTAAQADSTNAVTVWITDNGLPEQSNNTTFAIVVGKPAPVTLTSVSLENDNVHLRATGDPGILYSLQISIDLVSWTSLSYLEAPSTDFELVDSNVEAHPCRFYRVVGR